MAQHDALLVTLASSPVDNRGPEGRDNVEDERVDDIDKDCSRNGERNRDTLVHAKVNHKAYGQNRARSSIRRGSAANVDATDKDRLKRGTDHDAGGNVAEYNAGNKAGAQGLLDHGLAERPLHVVAEERRKECDKRDVEHWLLLS